VSLDDRLELLYQISDDLLVEALIDTTYALDIGTKKRQIDVIL